MTHVTSVGSTATMVGVVVGDTSISIDIYKVYHYDDVISSLRARIWGMLDSPGHAWSWRWGRWLVGRSVWHLEACWFHFSACWFHKGGTGSHFALSQWRGEVGRSLSRTENRENGYFKFSESIGRPLRLLNACNISPREETLTLDIVLKIYYTGCLIKNASTLKGRYFFRFEYFSNRLKEGKVWILGYRKKCIENSENPQKVSLISAFGNGNFKNLPVPVFLNWEILFKRPVQSISFRLIVRYLINFSFISRKREYWWPQKSFSNSLS